MKLSLSAAVASAALLAFPAIATPAAGPADPAALEQSRWRVIMANDGDVVLATDRVSGLATHQIFTFTLLANPLEGGADGILSHFEVNCDRDRVRDLGSTTYSGTAPRAAIGSQTGNDFIRSPVGTFYGGVRVFTCHGVPPMRPVVAFDTLNDAVLNARTSVARRH